MSDGDSSIEVSGLGHLVSGEGSTPVRRRRGFKRSTAACQRCRHRKQKCDGNHPSCEACLSVGVPCVPSERLIVRSDYHCECDKLRQKVLDLEAELENLRNQQTTTNTVNPRIEPLAPFGSGPENIVQSATSANQGEITHASEEKTSYCGRILLPTFRRPSRDGTNTSFLSSPWHLWHGLDNNDESRLSQPPSTLFDQNEEFVELFFSRRWPQFPILHKPTFMEAYYTPFINSSNCSELSSFQVKIVLAIGASEKSRTTPEGPVLHHHFFESAVRHIGTVLAADDLECIQNLLLLCIYGSNEPERVDLWYTVGLALRLALGIDLHRQETSASQDLGAEMRKRIFWCVYTMDRSMSIAMGRPIGLQDTDITTPPPLCLSDNELLQPLEQVIPSVLPKADDMSAFLHIIQLRRVNAEIYSSLHSAGHTAVSEYDTFNATRYAFLARLNEWLAAAPRFVAPTSMHQTTEWQQIAYHQAILTLFRPSHAAPIITLDAMRLCADSAISLVSCYNTLYAKNKVTYTFVALVSVFMAAVTMLYTLRASPLLRQELTKEIVESNIGSSAAMLRRISNRRPVGERSAQIIERLGKAILVLFESSNTVEEDVDTEFMSWFGLRCQQLQMDGQPTPSIDVPWTDLFEQGFDLNNVFYSDFLV